jgi:hypothetical protein
MGQAAGHDERDRHRLPFHADEIAPQLAVEMGEHAYQLKLETGTRRSLLWI